MLNNSDQDLSSYFLGLWRLGATRDLMEDNEDPPTELDTINSSGGFTVVSPDKLSVQYTNVNLHGHDVGVVQGNRPAPVRRLAYYFEIYVLNAGAKGQIAVGFTNDSFKMRRQPGWEANSYGYHGDDGLLYRGQGKGEAFGPTYTIGDTVGGGINYLSQEFFFTKNGLVVGTVSKDVKGPLYPTIAVHSQNEEVSVNFGKEPFKFDLKAFEEQERMKQQLMIEKISLQPNVSYGIVRSYLLHYGYEDTLNAFDMAGRNTVPPVSIVQENGFDVQENMHTLCQRKTIRQLIRKGEIDGAFSKLREIYPQLVQDSRSVICFMLHCQKFIELVRVGQLNEAVKYGRIELSNFLGMEGFEDLAKVNYAHKGNSICGIDSMSVSFLRDCVALLAYEQPQNSSVGYLLGVTQREVVADAVNAMILLSNPNIKDARGCLRSDLERLLRQLTVCCLERRSLNGDQGEAFHLHRVLNSCVKKG